MDVFLSIDKNYGPGTISGGGSVQDQPLYGETAHDYDDDIQDYDYFVFGRFGVSFGILHPHGFQRAMDI